MHKLISCIKSGRQVFQLLAMLLVLISFKKPLVMLVIYVGIRIECHAVHTRRYYRLLLFTAKEELVWGVIRPS